MKSISHSTVLPMTLHSRVRESLRGRILNGSFAPHAKLPAENELSSIFGVSRITVRQALSDLQNEGAVVKVAGKGTFVAAPRSVQPLTQLEGFGEAMSRLGHLVHNTVLSHRTIAAPATVAAKLELADGAALTEITRVRHLDNAPVSLEVTYLPPAIGDRLLHANLAACDIFLILEQNLGIALGHADLQVGAALADGRQAALLQSTPGSALLRLERLTHDASGKPIDFEYLYFRGDSFQYRLQLARRI